MCTRLQSHPDSHVCGATNLSSTGLLQCACFTEKTSTAAMQNFSFRQFLCNCWEMPSYFFRNGRLHITLTKNGLQAKQMHGWIFECFDNSFSPWKPAWTVLSVLSYGFTLQSILLTSSLMGWPNVFSCGLILWGLFCQCHQLWTAPPGDSTLDSLDSEEPTASVDS